MGYTLELSAWEDDFMSVFINFENPLAISKGVNNDRVICKI